MKIVDLLYAEPSLSEHAGPPEARRPGLAPPPVTLPSLDRTAIALFHRILAELPEGKPRTIQLVGPADGAPAAALVDALAVVACAPRNARVLLIDASADAAPNAPAARTLATMIASGGDPRSAIVADPAVSGLSHAPLCDTADALTRLGAPALQSLFETLSNAYDTILVDTGIFAQGGTAACVCPHTACTVLVVRAGSDRVAAVRGTMAGIRQARGTLIGTVLDAGGVASRQAVFGWGR